MKRRAIIELADRKILMNPQTIWVMEGLRFVGTPSQLFNTSQLALLLSSSLLAPAIIFWKDDSIAFYTVPLIHNKRLIVAARCLALGYGMQANHLAVEMNKSRNPFTDARGHSDFMYCSAAEGPSSGVKIRQFPGHLKKCPIQINTRIALPLLFHRIWLAKG